MEHNIERNMNELKLGFCEFANKGEVNNIKSSVDKLEVEHKINDSLTSESFQNL